MSLQTVDAVEHGILSRREVFARAHTHVAGIRSVASLAQALPILLFAWIGLFSCNFCRIVFSLPAGTSPCLAFGGAEPPLAVWKSEYSCILLPLICGLASAAFVLFVLCFASCPAGCLAGWHFAPSIEVVEDALAV